MIERGEKRGRGRGERDREGEGERKRGNSGGVYFAVECFSLFSVSKGWVEEISTIQPSLKYCSFPLSLRMLVIIIIKWSRYPLQSL